MKMRFFVMLMALLNGFAAIANETINNENKIRREILDSIEFYKTKEDAIFPMRKEKEKLEYYNVCLHYEELKKGVWPFSEHGRIFNSKTKEEISVLSDVNYGNGVTSFSHNHGVPPVPCSTDWSTIGVNKQRMSSIWKWTVGKNSITIDGKHLLNVSSTFDERTYKPIKPDDPYTSFYGCKGEKQTHIGYIVLEKFSNGKSESYSIKLACKVTTTCRHSNYYIRQGALVGGPEELERIRKDPEGWSMEYDGKGLDNAVVRVEGSRSTKPIDSSYNPYCFIHRTTNVINLNDIAKQAGITRDSLNRLFATSFIKSIDIRLLGDGKDPSSVSNYEQIAFNSAFLRKYIPEIIGSKYLEKMEAYKEKFQKLNDIHVALVKNYLKLNELDLLDIDDDGEDYESDVYKFKESASGLKTYHNLVTQYGDRKIEEIVKDKIAFNNKFEKTIDAVIESRNLLPDPDFYNSLDNELCKEHYAVKTSLSIVDSLKQLIDEHYVLNKEQADTFSRYFNLVDRAMMAFSKRGYMSLKQDLSNKLLLYLVAIDYTKMSLSREKRRQIDRSIQLNNSDFDIIHLSLINRCKSYFQHSPELKGKHIKDIKATVGRLYKLDKNRLRYSPLAKDLCVDIMNGGKLKKAYKIPRKTLKRAIAEKDAMLLYDNLSVK